MDELIQEFIAETVEGIQKIDIELVELERNPENHELLGNIFRIMHTIKGTCGFLGLNKLASIAHAGENIMDKIRNKIIPADDANISLVLEAIDAIKTVVEYIQEKEVEPETDYSTLINKLNKIADTEIKINPQELVNLEVNIPSEQAVSDISANNQEKVLEEQKIKEENVKDLHQNKLDSSSQTIRVHVNVLENLMQIISELVLNRNQLIQLDRTIRDNRFTSAIQRLTAITTSLQENVMETRMQPISNAWLKLPRLVRDLAKDLNKKINLVMIGKETELDRQLIESIKDPIMHMVRNSADHGIESPAERKSLGKSEEGTITLKAYHQGGHIVIELSDDGKGLDIKKIKAKALKNKLATAKELDSMTDAQVNQFVFRAGFSTSEIVTSVSGRGVGMDVVKNNIDRIRGTVDLKTIEGKGAFFTIKIPLTLAIMPILVIESCGQKFGLPQINILEMVKTGEGSEHKIEEINDNKLLRLRNSLLPLVSFSDILQVEDKQGKKKEQYIVICEVNSNNFGLIVDKIFDTEEIVLKPVSSLLKSISLYSGNTLLGNGDVIMIVDPSGIIKYINYNDKSEHMQIISEDQSVKDSEGKPSSFLILKAGSSLKAVALELVSRLEEIDLSKIETTNGKKVIQYRDSLMYLTNLDPNYQLIKEGKQPVVVVAGGEHVLGLIVEEILDIVEENIENNSSLEESDLSAIVLGGKTMDIVDVSVIYNKCFGIKESKIVNIPKNKVINLLVVDDSTFFRKVMYLKLTSKGFNVFSAETANEALVKLGNKDLKIDLIITDLNMPKMSGIEFIETCKKDNRLKSIPIIVITGSPDSITEREKLEENGVKYILSKSNYVDLIPYILEVTK